MKLSDLLKYALLASSVFQKPEAISAMPSYDLSDLDDPFSLPVIISNNEDIPYGRPGRYTINGESYYVKPQPNVYPMAYTGTDAYYFLKSINFTVPELSLLTQCDSLYNQNPLQCNYSLASKIIPFTDAYSSNLKEADFTGSGGYLAPDFSYRASANDLAKFAVAFSFVADMHGHNFGISNNNPVIIDFDFSKHGTSKTIQLYLLGLAQATPMTHRRLITKDVLIESRKIYQQIKNTNDLNYPHMHPFEFQRFLNTTLSAIDNTLDWISESHPEPSFEDISYYYASQFVTPIKILREKAPYDCMGDALSEQCISEWFKETPDAFSYLSEELKNDKAIVLLIAKHWGRVLERVTTVLQDDKDVVLAAVQNDARALRFASDKLKNDKNVVLAAAQNDGGALQFASDKLQDDKDVVLAAAQNDGGALQFASDKLQDDKDVVLTAIQTSGGALQFASDKLKNDKAIVLAAVQTSGWTLEFASDELQDDKDVVLAAVQTSGWALQFASDKLQDDKEVVLAAVQNDGRVLQFASDELKDDKVINLAAIQNDVWAFEFVSDELKDDFKFMLDAIEKEPFAFKYASDKLKKTLCFQAINKMPFLRFFMQYPRETSTAALGLTIIIAVSTIMNYRNTLKKTIDLESNPTSIKSRLMGLQNKPNPTNIAPDDADEMISTPSKYK